MNQTTLLLGSSLGTIDPEEQQIEQHVLPSTAEPMDLTTATHRTSQYNFSRHWRRKIVPLLDDQFVVRMLTLGLKLYDPNYQEGDPPWLCGRGDLNGQRARRGCLSWYQPWGRCHHIAPFCWALGKKIHPELQWGFMSGDFHTVVVGYVGDWKQPDRVMDILLFKDNTAQESLDLAQAKGSHFYSSLGRYVASFFAEPELAFETILFTLDE